MGAGLPLIRRDMKQKTIEQLLKSGKKHLGEQDIEIALGDFLEAEELDGDNPEIHYYLGIIYARMGRYAIAGERFEKILDSDLAYLHKLHTQMILGYIYTIREEYEKALSVFHRVLEEGVENAQAYAAIGYIMDRQGDFKEAVMNLYHAVEIDPKNANAHNSLGYIFAESNLNLDEALKECKKAVSLDKDNPAYLDSLGWVYFKLGDVSTARGYLKKALKMAPDNDDIREHLDTLLRSQGEVNSGEEPPDL